MSLGPRDVLLARLSDEQRQVVEQLGRGPIKVVAAAGSGKTTTMATLYSVAVLDGIPPPRILAVTFTERAANELKERIGATLQEFGGPVAVPGQQLQGAWIGTFHHVARRLLAEMPYLAGVPRQLHMLDEVDSAQELESVVTAVRDSLAKSDQVWDLQEFELPPRALLAVAGAAGEAVARLRSTDLSPEACRRRSEDAYRGFLSRGDDESEILWHRIALSVTLAVWEEYEERLRARRSLDFDGLLRQALDCLEKSAPLASWCERNFQLVIVDEHQDTSPIQAALLDKLVGPDQRKLFVVGDARQSIFAFRDAQPGTLDQSPGRSFRLSRNHRSLAPILSAADHVIRADPQFAGDHPMEVVRAAEPATPVWLGVAPTPEDEAEGIASFIAAVHRHGLPGKDGLRAVGYGDFAVLAYTFGRLGQPLEEALRRHGIPFRTATGGLLDRPEVKDVLALLRAVADDDDDEAWVRMLQSAWGRVSDQQISILARAGDSFDQSLAARARAAAAGDLLDAAAAQRVQELSELVVELRGLAAHRPAAEVLQAALRQGRLLPYHQALQLRGEDQGDRSLAAIRHLLRMALSAAPERWLGLSEFLARLDTMSELGGEVEPPPPDDRPLVTISTIHRAKGLEWPVVVLADCRPHHQRSRAAVVWDRQQQAVVVPRLTGRDTAAGARWKGTPDARVPAEEHRRLVYVAMTRAKDLLLVTTTRSGLKNKTKVMDELLEAARAGDLGKGEYAELVRVAASGEPGWVRALPGFPEAVTLPWAAPAAPQPRAAAEGPIPPPLPSGALAAALAAEGSTAGPPPRPSVGRISFSALQMLEACPRQFWFRHVAGIPDPLPQVDDELPSEAGAIELRSQAMAVGSLVHRVLEQVHRGCSEGPPTPAELNRWLAQLDPGLSASELEDASRMLHSYSRLPVAALPTLGVEVPFVWREWAAPELPELVGAIDRVALAADGRPLVVDYKTNRELTTTQFESYSHQLRLYAMAYSRLRGEGPATQAAIVMLRSGETLSVDCSAQAAAATLRWASELAQRTITDAELTGREVPDRPCATCAYAVLCPERLDRRS